MWEGFSLDHYVRQKQVDRAELTPEQATNIMNGLRPRLPVYLPTKPDLTKSTVTIADKFGYIQTFKRTSKNLWRCGLDVMRSEEIRHLSVPLDTGGIAGSGNFTVKGQAYRGGVYHVLVGTGETTMVEVMFRTNVDPCTPRHSADFLVRGESGRVYHVGHDSIDDLGYLTPDGVSDLTTAGYVMANFHQVRKEVNEAVCPVLRAGPPTPFSFSVVVDNKGTLYLRSVPTTVSPTLYQLAGEGMAAEYPRCIVSQCHVPLSVTWALRFAGYLPMFRRPLLDHVDAYLRATKRVSLSSYVLEIMTI